MFAVLSRDVAEIRDGLFVARNVTFSNEGDRSDYTIKAIAYDKLEHSTQASDKEDVKLDKHLDVRFWFKDDEQSNRGDKLGDVVKKTQTFTYTYGGGSGTETTRYYYNQARMLEYIDTPENNQDLKFTYDGLGRSYRVTPPSRRQSRGRLALRFGGQDAPRTAGKMPAVQGTAVGLIEKRVCRFSVGKGTTRHVHRSWTER